MTDRSKLMIYKARLVDLNEQATAAVPEIAVPADELRDMTQELLDFRELMSKHPAIERDFEDIGKKRVNPDNGGYATISLLENTARKYRGRDFAQMENALDLIKHAFFEVYLGNLDAAKHFISALDGGWSHVLADDIRDLEAATEDGWLELEEDEEAETTHLKCNRCDTEKTIEGSLGLSRGHSSIKVFYSNHRPYKDGRSCMGI